MVITKNTLRDEVAAVLRESIGAVLHQKRSAGKFVAPSGPLDHLVAELVNNTMGVLVAQYEELFEELHGYVLEHQSAWTVAHNAGGRGATLDIMVRDALRIAVEAGVNQEKARSENVSAL